MGAAFVKCDPSVDGTDNEEVAYGVNLSRGSCDCKGWVRWGTCKHLAAAGGIFVDGVLVASRLRGASMEPADRMGGLLKHYQRRAT